MKVSTRNAAFMLDELYASEINISISWCWDGGIDASLIDGLGTPLLESGSCPNVVSAVTWLCREAVRIYPESEFANKYSERLSQ